MTEPAGAQYNPFDREIVLQAISIWRSDERASRLSIPDLYKVILKANPTWRPKDLEIEDLTTGIAKVYVDGKTSNQKDTEPQQNDPESFPPFTSKRLLECLEAVSLAPNQLETPTYADKIHSVYPIPGLVMPTASAASWIDIRPFDHDPAHKGKGVLPKPISPPTRLSGQSRRFFGSHMSPRYDKCVPARRARTVVTCSGGPGRSLPQSRAPMRRPVLFGKVSQRGPCGACSNLAHARKGLENVADQAERMGRVRRVLFQRSDH